MESSYTRQPWNTGKLIGPKPPLRQKNIRAIRIQPRDQQQAAWLRSGELAGSGYCAWRSSLGTRDGRAARSPKAGPVRADRTDEGRRHRMNREAEIESGAIPVSEPALHVTSSLQSAACPHRASMGCRHRPRFDRRWHTYHAADQGETDLQTDEILRAVQLLLGHLKLGSTVKDQVCAVKGIGLRPDVLTQPIDVQEGSAWMLRKTFQDPAQRTIQEDSCMLSKRLS